MDYVLLLLDKFKFMGYIRIPNCSDFPQNGEDFVVNKWSDTWYMGASSGNRTDFPPGFWVLFRTLTVICKAHHALMFHQSAGMLFCRQSLFWDPSCGMDGYSLLHKPCQGEIKVMPWTRHPLVSR